MNYELLTIREVAALFRVNVSTIYKMVREKSIPAPIRVGTTATRWRADEIKNYLDERPRSLDVPAPQHANKTKAAA